MHFFFFLNDLIKPFAPPAILCLNLSEQHAEADRPPGPWQGEHWASSQILSQKHVNKVHEALPCARSQRKEHTAEALPLHHGFPCKPNCNEYWKTCTCRSRLCSRDAMQRLRWPSS